MEDKYFKPSPESERIFREAFEEMGRKSKDLNKAKEKETFNWPAFFIGVPIGLVFGALFVALGLFINGFVTYKLWGWFMTSAPLHLPALTICQAIGVAMIVRFMTYENPFASTDAILYNDKLKTSDKAMRFLAVFLGPWIILLIGYIVKSMI